jgi:putative protease
MSQAAFGRSGNRGVCAQPCRLPYTLTDGNGKTVMADKHLLSLKDMSLIESLPDLIHAGITSFKIEGRYKDASYVKNVTAAYRKALDRFIDGHPGYRKQSTGTVQFHFEPDLRKTFTRGYTTYFLHAPAGTSHQAAMDTPKSIGEPVGTVKATTKDSFQMKGEPVQNGDGLCFVNKSGHLKGFRVERVENGRIFPSDMDGVTQGVNLFRNHDHGFLKILDRKTAERKIRVTMTFNQSETDISLTVTDEDGHTAISTMPAPFEDARQPEKMVAQITSQLSSTGNTVFSATHIAVESNKTGFLPVSLLNSLRRDALEQLLQIRKSGYIVQKRHKETVPPPVCPDKTLDYHANILNRSARAFYERHGATVTENALESGTSSTEKILMTTRYCIRRELRACLKIKNEQAKLKGPLTLTHGKRSYRLEFDCPNCRMLVFHS